MFEKRLRMFAGPNGSGKSTVYRDLKNKVDFGVYINSDDIEKDIRQRGTLDLINYKLTQKINPQDFSSFIKTHTLYQKAINESFTINLTMENSHILNSDMKTHSYEASIVSDFIRNQLIKNGKKLTFETVMSHSSKIETLKKSKELGYKNYLYFISTENVEINKQRVEERVKAGGHPVPVDKIETRYYRSLKYLSEAIRHTHRAFIFDNSGPEAELILDVYKGEIITIQNETIPVWVDKYLLKFSSK